MANTLLQQLPVLSQKVYKEWFADTKLVKSCSTEFEGEFDTDKLEKEKASPKEQLQRLASEDIKAFKEKYPDIDINSFKNDADLYKQIKTRWSPEGESLVEVYESHIDFVSRVSQKTNRKSA